jgi:hypothetical protein
MVSTTGVSSEVSSPPYVFDSFSQSPTSNPFRYDIGYTGLEHSANQLTSAYSSNGDFQAYSYARRPCCALVQPNYRTAVNLTYGDRVTNSGSTAQSAIFDFTISSLQFSNLRYSFFTTGYSISIFSGTSALPSFSSSFSIQRNYDGLDTFSQSGVDLGLLPAYNSSPFSTGFNGAFGVNNLNESVDLGLLDPGQSLDLRYVIDIFSETSAYGGAAIFFDDPISSLHLSGSPTATIPEAPVDSLMAIGAAIAAVALRRRKTSQS